MVPFWALAELWPSGLLVGPTVTAGGSGSRKLALMLALVICNRRKERNRALTIVDQFHRIVHSTARCSYVQEFLTCLEIHALAGERGFVELADLLPVHNTPECTDVLGAAVLVVQVVRVFPDVDAKNRVHNFTSRRALHEGVVLVRRCHDL